MGLLKAFKELCETEGPVGEIAAKVGEGVFECGNAIADALDGLAERLGEIRAEHSGEEAGESCWVEDRLDPGFEKTPGLRAMRGVVDSIAEVCESASDAINRASLGLTVETLEGLAEAENAEGEE